jgi:hypothetical protein
MKNIKIDLEKGVNLEQLENASSRLARISAGNTEQAKIRQELKYVLRNYIDDTVMRYDPNMENVFMPIRRLW